MYNSDTPPRAELPTSRQLLRSTIIAVVVAAVILATIVLPSEYAIDPTGIGRVLGLTKMGEIKAQLAAEAAADAAAGSAPTAAPVSAQRPPAAASPGALAAPPTIKAKNVVQWRDETKVKLAPGQGAEVKLKMAGGAKASFSWTAQGGAVNFDTHGDGGGKSISYEKGRGVPADEGGLEAAFDGNHGWFWRNRGRSDVTVVLRTRGDYAEIKRAL